MANRTNRSDKKQRERFSITDSTNWDDMKFLKKFNIEPYIGYNSKNIHNKLINA